MVSQDIKKTLKQKGYKLTEQRRIIIEILDNYSEPCTAQQVFERAYLRCEMNFSTVYRNLELLSKLKILNKLNIKEGVTHFELKSSEHVHHVICKECGEMKTVNICPYKHLNSTSLEAIGFTATEHKFEIYGFCNKCNNKLEKQI